jgi:hypothetical protein
VSAANAVATRMNWLCAAGTAVAITASLPRAAATSGAML